MTLSRTPVDSAAIRDWAHRIQANIDYGYYGDQRMLELIRNLVDCVADQSERIDHLESELRTHREEV